MPEASIPIGASKAGRGDAAMLIYRDASGVRACSDRCRHMGGRLELAPDSNIATCPRHGWTLDVSSMVYVNPTGGLRQRRVAV